MAPETSRSKSLAYTLGIFILLGSIAALVIWRDVNLRQRAARTDTRETTSNARQLGIAFLEFDTDYGSFPHESTVPLVNKSHPTHSYDLSGSSSNALFRQLFAVDFVRSEGIFFAKVPGLRKPDGIIIPGEALKKGEVGFAYIAGLTSLGDPNRPLALTPLIPGTTKFDPKPFGGKAVILHTDNSVRSYNIDKDGHIYDKGINLLSAKHPMWAGITPDIRYPE